MKIFLYVEVANMWYTLITIFISQIYKTLNLFVMNPNSNRNQEDHV